MDLLLQSMQCIIYLGKLRQLKPIGRCDFKKTGPKRHLVIVTALGCELCDVVSNPGCSSLRRRCHEIESPPQHCLPMANLFKNKTPSRLWNGIIINHENQFNIHVCKTMYVCMYTVQELYEYNNLTTLHPPVIG